LGKLIASGLLVRFLTPAANADERPEPVIAVDILADHGSRHRNLDDRRSRKFNLFDTPVKRNRWEDPNGNTLVPWLAENRVRTSPRESVQPRDGRVMDAEDVAFSMAAERS